MTRDFALKIRYKIKASCPCFALFFGVFIWRNVVGKKYVFSVSFVFFRGPRQGGSVMIMLDSRPVACEFDPWLRQSFFPAYFHLSPLLKHVRKVVGSFGKKSCVSPGVRKPGNTCASPTAMIYDLSC